MKLKRILSTALTAAILFTTVISVFPVGASAAASHVGEKGNLSNDELKEQHLDPLLAYNYGSAGAMLEAELAANSLDYASSADGKFSMYVNRYTGVFYYVNNVTGQILTSNTYSPAYSSIDAAIKKDLMSQVFVTFSTVGSTAVPKSYDSFSWCASYGNISVSAIENGLKVGYLLGDVAERFLLPECLPEEMFENDLLIPMIQGLHNKILAALKEADKVPTFDFLDADGKISDSYRDRDGSVDSRKLRNYLQGLKSTVSSYCVPEKKTEFENLIQDAIVLFYSNYLLKNPNKYSADDEIGKQTLEQMYKDYPITKEGKSVYAVAANIWNDETGSQKRTNANRLKLLCPSYTYEKMEAAEAACGITIKVIEKPSFRCEIEYTFNSDGTLSVNLPSTSITYDETKYVVNSIIINKHFGSGDMLEDGYIFYPDGSGTIVEFADFYSNVNSERQNVTLSGSVYGTDYAYATITGAHRENVSLPVYGMVTTTAANAKSLELTGSDKTKGGFFTILEAGDSITKLTFTTGGAQHKYASIYPVFQPFASDTFDLSATLSVAGLTEHKIFAAERYAGNYTMRIKMLTETELALASGATDCYDASYVGMAQYYKDYLKERGVISKLEKTSLDIPLYIEALGSMEITKKILTFPVTVSIPLTRFEDIKTMYNEFTDAVNKLKAKADEYQALADAENKDANLKAKYEEKAAEYRRLASEVQNITNVNFRLTGFANGGMHYRYPAKVKWERACGGADGLKDLLDYAKGKTTGNANFGVFPEFDFLYVSNTAAFDGINNNKHLSLMIDNRYASKQFYNNISREFESFFDMVVNTEVIDSLYTKFDKQYSKAGVNKLSVSTLGSDLNSSFDSENIVDREEAKANTVKLLDRMANKSGYELMLNVGNVYTLPYATHLIDFSIDSSHFRYSSYSIPFTGMVLHGYVNYAGGALNYSGSDDYELLRSIENGAALYYILCYDNTNYMKDDYDLSKYYGVDYKNWFKSIVSNYAKINKAIGGLQNCEIVDHKVVYAERKLGTEESIEVVGALGAEFIDFADRQIYAAINAAYDEMRADPANKGRGVKVDVDVDALIAQALVVFDTDRETLEAAGIVEKIGELASRYETKYSGAGSTGTPYAIAYSSVTYDDTYKSAYNAVTSSVCTDDDYRKTDYTCDLGNVVTVTYSDGSKTVTYILNYNIYDVEVRLESGEVVTLAKYEYKEI